MDLYFRGLWINFLVRRANIFCLRRLAQNQKLVALKILTLKSVVLYLMLRIVAKRAVTSQLNSKMEFEQELVVGKDLSEQQVSYGEVVVASVNTT
jgi:hypothetical protein